MCQLGKNKFVAHEIVFSIRNPAPRQAIGGDGMGAAIRRNGEYMDQTTLILTKLMDVSALRQRVLANNLANINTPGYKRKDVSFKGELESAIKLDSDLQIENTKPKVFEDMDVPARPDGNTVSLEDEMAKMSENSLLYSFATQVAKKKFARLHSAIRGR